MKKIVAVFVGIVFLLGAYYYINMDTPKEPGKKNLDKSLVLSLTSDSSSAKIRYSTSKIEAQEGFVKTPWTKTVLANTARITASAGKGGSEVECKISDASTGKVLDRDSGENVSCYYTTF